MKSFFKKISIKFLAALILVSVLFPFSFLTQAGASSPTGLSDTMTRQQVSTLSSHTVVFTMSGSSQFTAGSTIVLDYGTAGFTLAAATTADVSFNDGTTRTVVAAGAAPACSAGVNNVTVTTVVATGVITITACSTYTASALGATVTFKIGTSVGGGTNKLTNPSSNGSKKIALTGTGGYVDSASSFAVPILTLDQVTVSATVDPSITSSLSATSCTFNPLSVSATAFCPITNSIATNSANGFTASVADLAATHAGDLCSPSVGTCTNNIPGASTLTIGTSGFGVRTSQSGQTVTNAGICGNDSAVAATILSNTYQQYANATSGPVSATPILCYKADLSATQAAGTYYEVSTHITTGNF